MITPPKKGDIKDIENYSLLSYVCKLFIWILQKRMEKVLDENQPRTGWFQKRLLDTRSHSNNQQLIENAINSKDPFAIDCEKAFHSIEHEKIFKALRTIGIYETYTTILEDIYIRATAIVHMANQVSEVY